MIVSKTVGGIIGNVIVQVAAVFGWILFTGFWDDLGIWDDNETWND